MAADRRPGLGQPPGQAHHDHGGTHLTINVDLGPVTLLLQRLEALITTRLSGIDTALEGLKRIMASFDEQVKALDTKYETVTTAFGTSIQSAIDRLAVEIGKQGTITPEVQAILDHMDGSAEGLVALNSKLVDAFVVTPPVPIPPDPEPIPEPAPVPEPVPEPVPNPTPQGRGR